MRIAALCILVLCGGLSAMAGDDQCDCTIFPWKPQCNKQCGIAFGTVQFTQHGTLSLSVPIANGTGTNTETFNLNEWSSLAPNSSRKTLKLEPGSDVTILYQKQPSGERVVKSTGPAMAINK